MLKEHQQDLKTNVGNLITAVTVPPYSPGVSTKRHCAISNTLSAVH